MAMFIAQTGAFTFSALAVCGLALYGFTESVFKSRRRIYQKVSKNCKSGAAKRKGTRRSASPWSQPIRSERQTETEFAGNSSRRIRARRVNESHSRSEVRRRDITLEVISVVSAVGEVEGLRQQLQVHPLTQLDVLGQAGVQFKERIAAQRIVLSNGALLGVIE